MALQRDDVHLRSLCTVPCACTHTTDGERDIINGNVVHCNGVEYSARNCGDGFLVTGVVIAVPIS